MYKRGLRKVGLVLAGSLTILRPLALDSTTATAASKPRKTAMISCSSDRLVRPTSYTLGCGTGTYVLTAITWTRLLNQQSVAVECCVRDTGANCAAHVTEFINASRSYELLHLIDDVDGGPGGIFSKRSYLLV